MKLLAEFVGSFLFYLIIALSVGTNSAIAPIGIGVALMAIIYSCASLSGSHFNPAVSFSMFMAKRMSLQEMGGYIGAQVAAGLIAFPLGGWLSGSAGGIAPAANGGPAKAFLVETLLTFGLCFVIFHTAATKRVVDKGFYGIAIGLYITGAIVAGGAISGAGYNPAVAIGATVSHALQGGGGFADLWLYIVGPILGAGAAALLFEATEATVKDSA